MIISERKKRKKRMLKKKEGRKRPVKKRKLIPVTSNARPATENDDHILLEKFKAIMKMSHRIEISRVSRSLDISDDNLFEKLINWNQSIPFKIDKDIIIVEDFNAFADALDKQFDKWEKKELSNEGKI